MNKLDSTFEMSRVSHADFTAFILNVIYLQLRYETCSIEEKNIVLYEAKLPFLAYVCFESD